VFSNDSFIPKKGKVISVLNLSFVLAVHVELVLLLYIFKNMIQFTLLGTKKVVSPALA